MSGLGTPSQGPSSSAPLPSGAATAANQTTGNTSLSSIDTKLSSQATAARQDTGNTSLASVDTKTPSLGQALAASSVPVVLTAAQISTLTPPAAITGFATSTNQSTQIIAEQAIQTALEIMDDWDESDRAKVNIIAGQAGVAAGVGATGVTVPRIVQVNDAGKTLVSTGGTAGSSGNNTLIAAGTNKLKVYAFSLSCVSTTVVTAIFQSGASGTELWRVILQTPASVSGGANLAVSPPAYLFATGAATLLNLNLSAAVTVHWSVAYYDEA